MASQRLDALEVELEAIKSTLQSHATTMAAQTTKLDTHSSKLDLIAATITDLSKSAVTLCDKMKETIHSGSSGSIFNHENNGNWHVDVLLAIKHIDLPPFTDDDPVGWLVKAESYFTMQNTPLDLRISLAQICMEGMTWHWFKVLTNTELHLQWETFKRVLLDHYGDHQFGNSFAQLKFLQQSRFVDEYVEAFKVLMAQVSPLSEDQYVGFLPWGAPRRHSY